MGLNGSHQDVQEGGGMRDRWRETGGGGVRNRDREGGEEEGWGEGGRGRGAFMN